jgi:hypothetical protein
MAHSIAGFSQGLADTNDPHVLAQRLGQLVIPGLASAFAVTMLALAATVVAHVCVTAAHLFDQEVLCDLDDQCAARLAALPSNRISNEDSASQVDLTKLVHATDRLAQIVGELAGTLPALFHSAKGLYSAAKEIEHAADSIRASTQGTYHLVLAPEKQP